MRRHDIDTIRVIALCLLILYHILVGFQPWGVYISFITNRESIEPLWKAMELINIWRIPILFVVSGMGVYFAMERRNWKQLFEDRTLRIFVPFIFGYHFVVPIYWFIFNHYYEKSQFYFPNPGHLWFLGNIFAYVLIFLPLLNYLKNHPENRLYRLVSAILRKPFGIVLLFASPLMCEALLATPEEGYALFAFTIHGLLIGAICFFSGFVLVASGEYFWGAVKKVKTVTLIFALSLYIIRIAGIGWFEGSFAQSISIPFESACWMLSAFGFAATFLNRPSKVLTYLSAAVYPVYVVHMPVQFFFSSIIFPSDSPVFVKLIMLILATYGVSLLMFECIKRIKWIRFLFGIKFSGA